MHPLAKGYTVAGIWVQPPKEVRSEMPLHYRVRYSWIPAGLLTICVGGSRFSVEHALSCPRGTFPMIRHKEIRNLTVSVLTEVCHDVRVEPDLQPITNETLSASTAKTSDCVRLDIAMNGFWGGRFEKTFVDVRVLNP